MSRKPLSAKMRDVARPPEGENFCWLTAEYLASPACRAQSIHCRRLIDFLLKEHLAHGGTENGNLVAPFAQLEKWGIGRRYIQSAIEEAEALRLVTVRRGALRAYNRAAVSRFRLTFYHTREENEFGVKYWAAATNEWRKTTDDEAKALRDGRAAWNEKKKAGAHRVTTSGDTVSPQPVHTVSPVKNRKPHKTAILKETPVVTRCALLFRSREGERDVRLPAQPDPSLFLAALASSQRACAVLIGASEATKQSRATSKKLAPTALSKSAVPA